MSRHHSHLNTAVAVLQNYKGDVPFTHVIKKFFSGQRKYGSRDRRQISSLCYMYFRASRLLPADMSQEEKVLLSHLLSVKETTLFQSTVMPEWEELTSLNIEEKLSHFDLSIENIFPVLDGIEEAIDKSKFLYSHLEQPDVFIRIRPGKHKSVLSKLKSALISFKLIGEDCVALSSRTKVGEIIKINRDIVIQDYSSQRVGEMLELIPAQETKSLKVWDCCAGSGGKSILAVDKLGRIDLLVSDTRISIMRNLKTRLQQAYISNYKPLLIDLTDDNVAEDIEPKDIIIADVPCSGSGTWGRTPERLDSFRSKEIEKYAKLQFEICATATRFLKPGGFFLYVTCSVYKQENSSVVDRLVSELGLQIVQSTIFHGYEQKADSMFASLLQKELQ